MCCADLLRDAQPVAPRRRDIVGVIPQDVGGQARHDIGHRQPGDALRPRPGGRSGVDRRELAMRTNENCAGCLTTAHQLAGYLPDAARFMTTRATASWPSTRLAPRLEINRGRDAFGLFAERRAGAVLVDQRGERPAALVEPRGLAFDRLAGSDWPVSLTAPCVRRGRADAGRAAGGRRDRAQRPCAD